MEPFIGQIIMFGGNFAPKGWAFCDGQLLPIAQNSALFSILGTTYGGDGRTTFALPDLRGRVSIHPGRGPGLSTYLLGEKGGTEEVTLTLNEIPSHNHSVLANSAVGTSPDPAGNFLANTGAFDNEYINNANVNMHPSMINKAGGSQSHTNLQPFLCVNYIIAMYGVFPSRG